MKYTLHIQQPTTPMYDMCVDEYSSHICHGRPSLPPPSKPKDQFLVEKAQNHHHSQ